jgi:hypothetical protein
LLPGLLNSLGTDDAFLDELPQAKRATLWFRQGAKHIFYISVVRKTGRCVVELGGLDSREVLLAVRVCRDHFDRWFGIAPEDIQAFERRTGGNSASATGSGRELDPMCPDRALDGDALSDHGGTG